MAPTRNAADILSRLFRLLNDPNRLKILFAIGKEKKSVSDIIQETDLPQTLVSFHLRPLRESGILSTERKGPFVFYGITEPRLIDLLGSLAGIPVKGQNKVEAEFVFPPMRFMRKWMKGGE
jgi:DNA-binding transcriptional ArsR family regulator